QLELEQEPVQFITVQGPKYLQESRNALGKYLNANADDLVYVTNPTYAVNIIAKSFPLNTGDEVLATDIEYGSCDRTWNYYCKKAGAVYKKQPIRFPIESKEDFIQQFLKGLTSKTKLIFISHITSSTGLKLPVEEVCAIAKQKNILTFIDGAHAPGQTPVDLKLLDVDMYTGACHKWMMTPKGCSFLYVKKDLQHLFDPLIISWGYEALFPSHSQFLDYHQTNGTRDFSAFLTVPSAIDFMQKNNWEKVSANYRRMVKENAPELCKTLNTKPIAPITDDFILQMYSAELKTSEPEKLKQYLYEKYKIEIPVMRQNDKIYLRYSLNAFNTQADIDKLFESIIEIKKETNFISE
ncbi:MAG: aminotransferase class V-fold PLP-dependent enzyme, partial [Bacteroidota bacterium]|nr:aminotransferase class V-fold PLP-dependent enzyme [Bacteroidota bacterium]